MWEKIRETAQKDPARIAYKVGAESLSYGELWSRAEKAAGLLRRQGNSPLILYGHKEPFMVIGMLAALLARRPYVPVDSATPLFRLRKIAALTKATLILSDKKVTVGETEVCSLSALEDDKNREPKECVSDIAYIIFTSGSTGEPKGVPISRDNLRHFADWMRRLSPLDSFQNAAVFNQAAFSFDLSVADLCYALGNGHTLVAFDGDCQNDFEKIFEIFEKDQINVAVMTPTFMKFCLLNREFDEKRYPAFRCVYFCGEVLESGLVKKLWERFPRLAILNAYGPTEATSAVSAALMTREMAEKALLPVGDVKKAAVSLEIRDGEIVLKGDSVFSGYLGGLTGGFFRENGKNCYRTGDLGFIEDGFLYCKGRADSQVKFKGYRIELSDVEQNLRQIAGVKEAVVVAVSTKEGAVKALKAFVIADEGVTADFIKAELAKRVPGYMVPKTLRIVERFLVNQNGKTDRKAMEKL